MFFTSISTVSRSSVVSVIASGRLIHTSPVAYKTVTEKVTEVADAINKGVGKSLASAIEKGEKATETAKQKLSSVSQATSEKAKETSEMMSQKKDQTMHEAKDDISKHMKKK